MIRILHFADLHLGVETYGRVDPTTGLSSRLGDFLEAFDQAVDYALDNDIDLVLFCGDAYRSRDPSQTYQREFAKRIRRLIEMGKRVFLLAGNHDLPNAVGRATAVEIFDTLNIRNVIVANFPQTCRIDLGKCALQIVALPWVRYGKLLSREDTKNLSMAQLNQKLQEILTSWLNAQADDLDPGVPAILAAHLAHSEAVAGSEKIMMLGRDYFLLRSNLANPAFDYVALGHMHRRQTVDHPVPVVYPGSLQSIDFGDEGDEKGFYVVQIDETAAKGKRLKGYDFVPVKTRRFLTIEIDANTDNPMATVLQTIAKKNVSDAIVRIHIKVSADRESMVQESEIRKALKESCFIAAISKEIEREHRARLGARPIEGITPLQALKLYLESKKTPEERRKVLLEYGEKLIQQCSAPE